VAGRHLALSTDGPAGEAGPDHLAFGGPSEGLGLAEIRADCKSVQYRMITQTAAFLEASTNWMRGEGCRDMRSAQEQIGLSAMGLDGELKQVTVHRYRAVIESDIDEKETTVQVTRKVARLAATSNGWQPVTDLEPFVVGALQPLRIHEIDRFGFRCRLLPETETVLDARIDQQRAAIERLLNQDLHRAALRLEQSRVDGYGQPLLKASRHQSGWVEIAETGPSERVNIRAAYLELFKTLRLTPELLPSGQVIVGLSLRHKICARDGISLDWVIQQRPQWLQHIRRVRHRYSDQGKPAAVADYHGVVSNRNSDSPVPGTPHTLYSYHEHKRHIPAGQAQAVKASQVVEVSYAGKKKVEHLAALLEPMFDFETLRKIDSPLLNRIASKLKWSVMDRLKTTGEMVKGLTLPGFKTRLVPIEPPAQAVGNICPPFRLRFRQGRTGDTEKAVLKLGAFQGMTRTQVVCLAVGTEASPEALRQHFQKLRDACGQLFAASSPKWFGLSAPRPLKDARELDERLTKTPPENTLLLIAIDASVSKAELRDVSFRHELPCQFMRTDHPRKVYAKGYYQNLAAGVFSKGGGLICDLGEMPGEVDLFIGLDLGGVSQRAPGSAFLFTRNGAQLGWQLTDLQSGERMEDKALKSLLQKSIDDYGRHHNGASPNRITLHRDGRFFESLEVIQEIERQYGVKIDVLEVIKSGAPILYRRYMEGGRKKFKNPDVGDVYRHIGLDELILATYSGQELGRIGNEVSVRPLRLRKRYGEESLDTLAQQVLLLSRIHGASLFRHPRLPVTTHHADRFATLRQNCDLEALSHMDRTCPVYL